MKKDLTVEIMKDTLLKEEQQLWDLFKKAENKYGSENELTKCYRAQHREIMNLIDEFEIKHL